MADEQRQDGGFGSQVITVLQNGVIAINNLTVAVKSIFTRVTGTSGTATGGAATLPANPQGFMNTNLPDGTAVKIPYYLP